LQARYNNPFFAVPVPTMNLGHIHGGDNPNRICANCELHLDLRPLPGMAIEELRAILRERVTNTLKDSGLKVEFVALFQGIEAIETPAEAEIVQIAERLTNYSAESVAFATEAPYLKDLGMDTIILGPGNIAQAHQPDEFITLKSLQPMIDILTQMIRQLTIPTTF
jgi:acetylornithine deacetylase